ncbi:SDR family NAD(P)-dependent oxidoreductase [Paracoccus sp. NSM]|uniref:SDR family NAD(P)-dependent oxidoreductase n=1 Tax=Paracoccus sp. NSM TaxID=3457784 RepID=UPI004036781D
MNTQHRVALVIGAATGIGLALARRLSRDGMAAALADLDPEAPERAAAGLGVPRRPS